MVALYLGAIVAANFTVARFGQAALPFTAFVLIPFDLVTRDVLHEHWTGPRLWQRMAVLILAGSALTAALSWDAARIAVASASAFSLAGLVNAGVYHVMRERPRLVRMNVSNAAAAVVDSLVFPVVAFWPTVDPLLSASQAGSKFVGGLFWSWLFVGVIWRWRKQ